MQKANISAFQISFPLVSNRPEPHLNFSKNATKQVIIHLFCEDINLTIAITVHQSLFEDTVLSNLSLKNCNRKIFFYLKSWNYDLF